MNLTKEIIGEQITRWRKMNGLSQEELSRCIGMSRSSLAKVESGKRSLTAVELQQISLALRFSVDEFLSGGVMPPTDAHKQTATSQLTASSLKPTLKLQNLRNVLLYILERCAGKPNVGETVLYKMLYFADFNYYELYQEFLTGAVYRKLPYGPVPRQIEEVLEGMIRDGELQRLKCRYQGYPQTRYVPLKRAELKGLSAIEKEVIDSVIERFSDMSGSAISAYSHNDKPWLASKNGEEIGYHLALMREPPYSARR